MPPSTSPGTEYRTRLARWQAEADRLQKKYGQLGNLRLLAGLALAAIATAALGPAWISAWWLLAPVLALAAMIAVHPSIDGALRRARRLIAFYERGLSRVNNTWAGQGSTGEPLLDPNHVYASDLDLFGRGSLFELLSTARTATGERVLASWLLAPGDPAEVTGRQEAVRELAPNLALREDLAIMGDDIRAAIDHRKLAEWGALPPVRFFTGARVVAAALAAAAVISIALWIASVASLLPFLVVILAELLFGFAIAAPVKQIAEAVNAPARELKLIAGLLERLLAEPVTSPGLAALQAKLRTGALPATSQIRTLVWLVEWMEWAYNQFFALIGLVLLWIPQFALAIEVWRRQSGPHIGEWVAAVGEFEAVASLASFAHERPDATFPTLLDTREPYYEAAGLIHPLLPPAEAIDNDVVLGGETRMWMISGSNMSGKSTLLRAVGISAAMAWAGAPVTARSLRVSRLHIGASMRANDSVTDHRSRFYAEISRLKQVVDLARAGHPVLFLLDELLSGTNSHDRRIGAEALLRGLLEQGAIGLATTHDLALAEIAAAMGPRARNVHLEDHIEDGRMSFDYKLRPGVVERSNALALMRAVGLDV